MPMVTQDKTGHRFGMLTVLGRDGYKRRYAAWKCRCDCGKVRTFASCDLTHDGRYSCGCVRRPIPLRYVISKELIEAMSIPEPNSGCWIWLGTTKRASNGEYGRISQKGKAIGAHRASYLAHKGDPGNLFVCHRCDNPLCVNPGHLFLGDALDNNRDMMAKGRNVRGAAHPESVLTDDDVRTILADPRSSLAAAADYGVDPTVIRRIRRGEAWRHVSNPEAAYDKRVRWVCGVGAG